MNTLLCCMYGVLLPLTHARAVAVWEAREVLVDVADLCRLVHLQSSRQQNEHLRTMTTKQANIVCNAASDALQYWRLQERSAGIPQAAMRRVHHLLLQLLQQ